MLMALSRFFEIKSVEYQKQVARIATFHIKKIKFEEGLHHKTYMESDNSSSDNSSSVAAASTVGAPSVALVNDAMGRRHAFRTESSHHQTCDAISCLSDEFVLFSGHSNGVLGLCVLSVNSNKATRLAPLPGSCNTVDSLVTPFGTLVAVGGSVTTIFFFCFFFFFFFFFYSL